MFTTTEQRSFPRSALKIGASLVVCAGCLFATQDAVAKLMSASYSPFQVVWIRLALHAVLVGAWLHARGHHNYLRTQQLPLHAARAAALVGVTVSMYWAVSMIPLAQATVIQFLSPILVTLLSVLFLGERIGWRRTSAVAIGFSGVIIILAPGFVTMSYPTLLPLITAISLAIFVLLSRRLSSPKEEISAFGLLPILCTLMVLPIVPFVWQTPALADAPIFIFMALCGTAAHVCLQIGLRYASAATMAPFLYAQVIWAAILSVLIFADPLGLNFFIGVVIIVGSGFAIWWFENRAASNPSGR